MDSMFEQWARQQVAIYRDDGLLWLPEHGMGHQPNGLGVYDQAYFEEYVRREATDLGHLLIEARLELVRAHYGTGQLVDVGVGAGGFITKRGDGTHGYDINPVAVTWLQECELWWDLRRRPIEAATFWDSLEHIANPGIVLAQVTEWAFISLPIFEDKEHIRRSKHYKPEHLWYWTHDGLVAWMNEQGWDLAEWNRRESELGREDIETFAFTRR